MGIWRVAALVMMSASAVACGVPKVAARARVERHAATPAVAARSLAVITSFYGEFRDGTDFEFLRAACRPELDGFGALERVDIDTLIAAARAFYRDKRGLSYEVDTTRAEVTTNASEVVVEVPVRVKWESPAPNSLAASIQTIGSERALVARDVVVKSEIAIDLAGRITRLIERHTETPTLLATGEHECSDDRADMHPNPWFSLPAGVRVEDLGETVVIGVNIKGADEARRVRWNGQVGWALYRVSFAVENPYGGTSAGVSECLWSAGRRRK
jgi:hypothetical protein